MSPAKSEKMNSKEKTKKIVDADEYQQARTHLLKQEKEATQLLQSLAAARRELPMVQIPNPDRFKFDTPEGEKSLVDIFDGRDQLIIYHFMLGPGEHAGCVGCSFCMDHIPTLEHLRSRNTSFAAVATAPLSEITTYRTRMGWKFPFYSSAKTHEAWKEAEQAGETVTWKPGNGYFGLCVSKMAIASSIAMTLPIEVGNGMGKFSLNDEYGVKK
ncbi:hypothetical protein N7508_003463 [Penicillium antarcticum]|uniref:uncharacterized protein n=1 Tax=Penicillium antarcticum TaxID=416450 RepID=UPI002392E66A|nr:uncharacterized protein N7508_003463 [Penicillium antarcticum]KAJ5312633.1 hypothetical protein N7508_003463 [Penicillium antarcticum]